MSGWYRHKDITGLRFNKWTVIKHLGTRVTPGASNSIWLCRCDCGHEQEHMASTLKNGFSKGCMKCRTNSHGHSKNNVASPTYRAYKNMIARCYQASSPSFEHYSTEGIGVCDRWRYGDGSRGNGFKNFLADMGERPIDRPTIDRIDVSKGYGPDNCRWASWRDQGNNRRTNLKVTYRGKEYTFAQLVEISAVDKDTLRYRLVRATKKWPINEAVESPMGTPHPDKRR